MRPVLGAPAFDTLRAKKMDALYVAINELLNANRLRIVTSAQAAKLPTILGTRDWAGSGGLRSYGPNFPALSRELVVNLNTAKAIGITLPAMLVARADTVIE